MEKNTTTSAVKKKRFVLELSTPEAVGWAALVIFICGWFFILGIFVGRGLVPVPGENDPGRPYFAKAETPPPPGPEPADRKPPEPPAPVAAVPAPPAAPAEAGKAPPDKAPPVTPVDEKAPTTVAEPPPAASMPEEKPVKQAETGTPAQKDSGNKTAETGGKIFTVQVTAVRDRRAADECYEKLKKQKYAPDGVQAIQSGGVTWYRLRCGRFASHDEAAPMIERLRKDGYSPILVRR